MHMGNRMQYFPKENPEDILLAEKWLIEFIPQMSARIQSQIQRK